MKKSFFLVFMLILLCTSGYTQEKMVKSGDMKRSLIYLDSAAYFEKSDFSRSFDFVEKALTVSLKAGDKYGEALSYQSLGRINFNLNQYDLAIDYYRKAVLLFGSEEITDELNDTYELLGDAFLKSGNVEQAEQYYGMSLKYAQAKGKAEKGISLKNKIADLYMESGESDKSLELYNEVLQTEKKRGNTSGIIEAQNNIASVYQQSNKEKDAIKVYDQSATMAAEANDEVALKKTLKSKSSALRQSGKYDEELEVRKQLLDISAENEEVSDVAEENLQIGNIYMEKNEADKAIPYIQKSIKLSDETMNLEKKSEALQVLSTAYGRQQNYNKALETYRTFVETMDAVYKKREADILAGMQIATTLNRKLERLDLIEKDLQLSRKTVELLRQEQIVTFREMKAQRVLTWSLSGALFILTVASFFVLRSANLKRRANQLLALRSLRSQMNPHFIYNSLNSVNSYISKNNERAANKYLADFSKLMRSVMENSKHDFVPLSGEIETLKLYLTLEHSRFNDKFDYSFDVDKSIEAEGISIPPMLIQPFIENAIWHGLRYRENKGFLKVELKKSLDVLTVFIEDDGIGRKKSRELKTKFQKERVSTGLMNIENRVQIINRIFHTKIEMNIEDLDEKGGEGTRVVLTIPLNRILMGSD